MRPFFCMNLFSVGFFLHAFFSFIFPVLESYFSVHFIPHQNSHMFITFLRSDTPTYIVGKGEFRDLIGLVGKQREKGGSNKKVGRVFSSHTTRKPMRPLLIFPNCFERLNLAFTDDFSLFFETFHLCGTTYPFRQQQKHFFEAMQRK